MFVAVGRGSRDGSVPITARESSNVTSGVHIGSRAGSYSGRVSLGLVLQGLVLVAIAASAIIGLMQGILITVEQAIKLLTIVLSIYEFAVGEFPGRARIT